MELSVFKLVSWLFGISVQIYNMVLRNRILGHIHMTGSKQSVSAGSRSILPVFLINVIEANCRAKRDGMRRRDALFSDGLPFMENHNS